MSNRPGKHALTRRSLLGAALAAPAASVWPRLLRSDFASPKLHNPDIVRFVAGLRPARRFGVRIERERIGDKTVVHNYGHGGSGVTMSWGSAEEALRLVSEGHKPPVGVAVLGSGALGPATTPVLQGEGFAVSI